MRVAPGSKLGAESSRTTAAARRGGGLIAIAWLLACGAEPIDAQGQIGRPMALATGDGSSLPRLAFIDESCPGTEGGCATVGEGGCQMLLIDSLSPLTAVRDESVGGSTLDASGCLEVRPAAGLAAPAPADADRAAAVARFRFDNLPLVRAPTEDGWSWTAGNERTSVEPGGVLGGNLLRNFAVEIRSPPPRGPELPPEPPSITLYGEYPGSESNLADQGRAFIPLQFPGRLLGRELTDRCAVENGMCEVDGFDLSTSSSEIPLAPSRMVLDACVAIPPCGLVYGPDPDAGPGPFVPGKCGLRTNPDGGSLCSSPTDPLSGGISASLVVATGVPGMVLFSDSAERMFGDPTAIDPCPTAISPTTEVEAESRVCRMADEAVLHFAGWPSAGQDTPLTRLRIRSVALVPGAARSRSAGPCQRAQERRAALERQCVRYTRAARVGSDLDIRNTAPPYSAGRDDDDGDDHVDDPSATSLVVLGEALLAGSDAGPRPARWLTVTVLPVEHPLTQAVRRDVAPDALEPDGLLGTALLGGTETVLDYTDLNPAVRVSCLEPHEGRCQALPDCATDRQPACCHGLPRAMLDELIRGLGDDTCCAALSAGDLAEMQEAGHCEGVLPP